MGISREAAIREVLGADNDGSSLLRIPEEKRNQIVSDICKPLIGSGLSLMQAEMLLEVAKGHLYRVHI